MFNIIFCAPLFPGRLAMEDDMPYSAKHKQDTRQRILESARRLFNSKGFAEVSIGEIMANAGLTHGGFYRHFNDKSELYAEAVQWFLCEEAPKPWQRPRRSSTRKSRAQRIVDAYFSLDHFEDRESCCPLIGLPSGRGAQRRCREGCLSGRSGEAAWSPASGPRGTRRARARPVAGGPVRRRHGRGAERGGPGLGP
jgi:AcrR family transcriptional regulator